MRWWISQWQLQSARINTLRLRERVLLFLAVAAICIFVVHIVWWSPASLAFKELTEQFNKQSAELQSARDVIESVATPTDEIKALRSQIASVNIKLGAVNQTIMGGGPVGNQLSLTQALFSLLHRHKGLTLLNKSTITPEVASENIAETVVAVLPAGLTRQSIQLRVSGPYLELMRYLEALENALPYVRWGSMHLKSDKRPTELTLQLFVIDEYLE
jgi:MSHA biogenesis protein MshJ